MQCACEHSCTCEVTPQQSIERNGNHYCSEACANGHPRGEGCGHSGCSC
jgi:metallothionein